METKMVYKTMKFSIDKQSLDELNLLGKFSPGSIYFLFRQVKSSGGAHLLEELFKNPLVDENVINDRTAVFRFFEESNLSFPFDPEQLNIMNDYVDGAVAGSQVGNYMGVLFKLISSRIARGAQYKQLIQGLQATIGVLKKCHHLLMDLDGMAGVPAAYRQRIEQIKKTFSNEKLAELIETDVYRSISPQLIASYDYLIKSSLRESVNAILHFIAEVDVNINVGKVTRTKGFTYARAYPGEANVFKAKGLGHPAIDDAVGNDIEMQSGSNVVFLTGANMAGKSTWMKSIGINMYLAHIGFPVAAQSMEFSIREGIYSSINVGDDIGLGYSHFYAEVIRVKHAAEATATGKRLLLMFDELFKGTNVKDAYDGTLAVTEAFSEYNNCLFIVSTHIIEVGEALRKHSNIQFAYLPTVMQGSIPRYTYKLEQGITEDRQGMMIIRNEKILSLMGL
jgi:DNA mismatch repair protein MutS